MARNRRAKIIRALERVAIGIVILDAVLYFAVLQPIRNMKAERQERFHNAGMDIVNEESRVKRLEWYKNALPMTEKNLEDFLSNDVQSRKKSFSRATRLVRGLADDSGLEFNTSGIAYHVESLRDEPLERLNLGMTVKGPFASLLNFAHDLETTSDDFVLIHDFNFDAQEGGNPSLRLSADLYLTP